MGKEIFESYIEERFYVLQKRVIMNSKLNVLHLNIIAEDFYRELFNIIYGYQLINLNVKNKNAAAIDLIDEDHQIMIQVTSTVSKQKIESTLSKNSMKDKYKNYHLYFMFIGENAAKLRKMNYENPYNICFKPQDDIYDVDSVLSRIKSLDINDIKEIYNLVKDYLQFPEIRSNKVNDLLPTVIKKMCIGIVDCGVKQRDSYKEFEISEKIKFNNLKKGEIIIKECIPYEYLISNVYDEYERAGKLKSMALLRTISRKYNELTEYGYSDDDVFKELIQSFAGELQDDKELNEADITLDEIIFCIEIIIVDAFIRCKIFKRPEVINNVNK